MNYFRRQTRLNPHYLNSWERRTFGRPSPVWVRDAMLILMAIAGIDMIVDFWMAGGAGTLFAILMAPLVIGILIGVVNSILDG